MLILVWTRSETDTEVDCREAWCPAPILNVGDADLVIVGAEPVGPALRSLLTIADPATTADDSLFPATWNLDETLGLGGTVAILLMRPNAHLSFRSGSADLTALAEHAAMFVAPAL